MKTKEAIVERIGKQLASPVLWMQDVIVAKSLGCQSFVEIGPKPVLASLVRAIDPNMDVQ